MKKGIVFPVIAVIILLITLVVAIGIKQLKIYDVTFTEENLRGNSVDFYFTVSSERYPVGVIMINVEKPNGQVNRFRVREREKTGRGVYDYHFKYVDTILDGFYTFQIEVKAGKYKDYYTGKFEIKNMSYASIDLVNLVKKVDEVSRVKKLTNQTMMDVFGTEYQVGDDMKIYLQLLEGSTPINNASCHIDVFFPNKTMWQNNAPMVLLNNSEALYYYDLLAPNITGVYMISASCRYQLHRIGYFADSYNISQGTHSAGSISSTHTDNGNKLKISDVGNIVDVNFTFQINDNISNGIELDLFFNGRFLRDEDGSGELKFYIYDYINSSWVEFNNWQNSQHHGSDQDTNNVLYNNLSKYISENKTKIRLRGTGTEIKKLEIDFLELHTVRTTGTPIDNIRGGGELHVTDHLEPILSQTDLILERIQQINSTVTDMWTYLTGTLTDNLLMLNKTTIQINETLNGLKTKIDDLNISGSDNYSEQLIQIENKIENTNESVNEVIREPILMLQ